MGELHISKVFEGVMTEDLWTASGSGAVSTGKRKYDEGYKVCSQGYRGII
jgi:hypothetical protein